MIGTHNLKKRTCRHLHLSFEPQNRISGFRRRCQRSKVRNSGLEMHSHRADNVFENVLILCQWSIKLVLPQDSVLSVHISSVMAVGEQKNLCEVFLSSCLAG